MAGTQAIAAGKTAASYAFSNTTSAPKTIYLTPADGKELVAGMVIKIVKKKASGAHPYEVFRLTKDDNCYVCLGNGDFELVRPVQDFDCGADIHSD